MTGNKNNSTTKVSKAAALKYDGKNTPKLTAKGDGAVAEEIIAIAKQNDVHIHYDPLLLDVLARLELGDEIPEDLYLAVAKIIAFAYYLQGKHPETKATSNSEDSLTLENNRLSNSPPAIINSPQTITESDST